MTGKEFVDLVRLYTRTNSTTLSNADLILLANARLEELARSVLKADEDVLTLPMTTNLIAGRREYPLPVGLLSRIKYVEICFDGTNWVHLDEFDLNKYRRTSDESTILANFSNEKGHCFYDIDRKSLWIYSGTITAIVGGMKLWCNTYMAKLDNNRIADNSTDLSTDPTSVTHGVPRELHEIWARGVSIDWKSTRQKPIPLTERELNYKVDLQDCVMTMQHGNYDRSVYASIPPASDRGNNGANY